MKISKYLLLAFCLCPLAFGCGEGSGRLPVAGNVSLDGSPLPDGSIVLIPIAPLKGPKVAAEIKGGEFALSAAEGPVQGQHRVEIYANTETETPLDNPLAFAKNPVLPKQLVPPQYNSQSSLQLETSADEEENHFTFALTTR